MRPVPPEAPAARIRVIAVMHNAVVGVDELVLKLRWSPPGDDVTPDRPASTGALGGNGGDRVPAGGEDNGPARNREPGAAKHDGGAR
jgi:hypothetical protein